MRKWMCLVCVFFTSVAQASNSGAILSVVLGKIEAKQWENAASFAGHADDPMVGEILDWYALRDGRGELADYEAFLKDNADWPGLPLLQKMGETKLSKGDQPNRIIAMLSVLGPQTSYGLVRLVEAYLAKGQDDLALKAFEDGRKSVKISRADMDELQALLPQIDDARVRAYVHELLDDRAHELARGYLDAERAQLKDGAVLPDAWKIIEARLILIEDNGGVNVTLEALTEELRAAPPLAFERARYAFRKKNREAAAALMREVSTSREALYKPDLWMEDEMRTRLAGDPLWNGDPMLAYDSVANHFIKEDEEGYALAEWLAGFIALEYLKEPKVALQHFTNFRNVAKTPISLGRAGYWMGRAGDPDGYALGAKYQTSFYGQLAAEMGGIAFDEALLNAPKPRFTLEMLQKDSVHAGLLFYNAGAPLMMNRFFAQEAESLSPEDAEALGLLSLDLGVAHGAIAVGKNLARRGEEITHSIFPVPDLPTQNLATPKALTLAIMRQESEFYQYAESWVGAKGYMQLMPATAQKVAGDLGLDFNEAALKTDGVYNVTLGSAYAAEVGALYDNRVLYIAVGYNAGPNRVQQWIEHLGPAGPKLEDAVRWAEMIRFEETRNYAQRVLEGTFLYDAKLNGEYRMKPSDLLLKPYW